MPRHVSALDVNSKREVGLNMTFRKTLKTLFVYQFVILCSGLNDIAIILRLTRYCFNGKWNIPNSNLGSCYKV